jgi:hypothetical protein
MKLKCIFATFFAKECFISPRDKRHFLCRSYWLVLLRYKPLVPWWAVTLG